MGWDPFHHKSTSIFIVVLLLENLVAQEVVDKSQQAFAGICHTT